MKRAMCDRSRSSAGGSHSSVPSSMRRDPILRPMLQHVANETRREDADAVLAFWALLGFTAVEPPPTLRGRTHWVQRGGTQIHLLLTDDPVVPPSGHAAVVV